MYDVWAVFYNSGVYALGYVDSFETPRKKEHLQLGNDTVGVFCQDSETGEYIVGVWADDFHRVNFFKGKDRG